MAGVEEGSSIRKILRQSDGKLVIAGKFNAGNGVPRLRVARLCMDSGPAELHLFAKFTDATRRTNGLAGSYTNSSLRSSAAQNDWRLTQTVTGRRVDTAIPFTSNGWGSRAEVGLTGVTDADWENSTDPDHGQSLLQVEWDVDGDGRFDTAPTTAKTLATNFASAGVRLIHRAPIGRRQVDVEHLNRREFFQNRPRCLATRRFSTRLK